jgi:cytochrome c oxidase subunit 4
VSSEGRIAWRRNLLVWAALMVLLLLTVASTWLRLGAWNSVLNLAIATLKALLVAIFFMRLRRASALLRLVAAAALLALAVLFGLSHTDYATRSMQSAPWQKPPPLPHSGE